MTMSRQVMLNNFAHLSASALVPSKRFGKGCSDAIKCAYRKQGFFVNTLLFRFLFTRIFHSHSPDKTSILLKPNV
jgi:hypothetical protein